MGKSRAAQVARRSRTVRTRTSATKKTPRGSNFLGHRYYDPSTGRFLTRDPIRDGRNWYMYGGGYGNPTGFADPDGLSPGDIIGIAGVAYSWYEFSKDPSPSNFGWALLDTVTEAVPIIPGTSVVRHGPKVKAHLQRILQEAHQKAAHPPRKPGQAPLDEDRNPLELHHPKQLPDPKKVKVLTRPQHRLGPNYKMNHPNTGKKPSKIDRNKFAKFRAEVWKAYYEKYIR